MAIKYIKKIPKYITQIIHKTDLKYHPNQDGHVRFYAYLAIWSKELVKVTVAVKNHKKQWYCKQVAVHGIDSEKCAIKDIVFNNISGYSIGWYDMNIQTNKKWFEDSEWYEAEDKYFDPWAYIINKDFITKITEFKYCYIFLWILFVSVIMIRKGN